MEAKAFLDQRQRRDHEKNLPTLWFINYRRSLFVCSQTFPLNFLAKFDLKETLYMKMLTNSVIAFAMILSIVFLSEAISPNNSPLSVNAQSTTTQYLAKNSPKTGLIRKRTCAPTVRTIRTGTATGLSRSDTATG
jgi:hypothetical protein